ncbi:transcription factor MYB88-like isoform X2 [Punica granatum]|uniref:Transcription factor MYB88-like isoform X2 n=1 Tax=Punica granatum TaxID=22663 RepID=A0A6P8CRC9_PUNGR|nr:transcription factor MYB88-like isoform X2 [Punica granatum]
MPDSKKKVAGSSESDSKKKERHIVTWTPEEDDILREVVRIHGTENWPAIALKFKDKSTRQCRRRWSTYLNSDFKRGGWSPEEDKLLCEAQKVYGNRWTEIAKVVSGRTDNAVKNRFTTLCKKRAKYEALAKENKASCVNPNGKRVISCGTLNMQGATGVADPNKKSRGTNVRDVSLEDDQQPRPPFAVLAQNLHHKGEDNDRHNDDQGVKTGETFLRTDDPKFAALMRRAELLSSLAQRVKAESTEQSLENAEKVLQDIINQSKDGDIFKYCNAGIDFQLHIIKDMMGDFTSSNEGSQTSWRQPDLCEDSPATSEYSTGSTYLIKTTHDKTAETEAKEKSIEDRFHIKHTREKSIVDGHKEIISTAIAEQEGMLRSCDEKINTEAVVSVPPSKEFGSPLQVTPVFRSIAAGIPSPKFSESERNFLMKTLGMESLSPSPSTNINPPSCKRSLLQTM